MVEHILSHVCNINFLQLLFIFYLNETCKEQNNHFVMEDHTYLELMRKE